MKNKSICPKCNSDKIARAAQTHNLDSNKIIINTVNFSVVTRYVCLNCGYVEEWIDTQKDIDKIEKKFGQQQ